MTAAAENEWICITIKSKLWLKELDPAHIAQKHSSWKVNAGIVENYTIKNWQSICPEIATPSLKALKAGAALLNIGGLGTTSKSSFIQILGLGFIGNKNLQKNLQRKKYWLLLKTGKKGVFWSLLRIFQSRRLPGFWPIISHTLQLVISASMDSSSKKGYLSPKINLPLLYFFLKIPNCIGEFFSLIKSFAAWVAKQKKSGLAGRQNLVID